MPLKRKEHKAKKADVVARLHFSGNPDEIAEWLRSLVAHNISTEKFQTDGVNNVNACLRE